MTGGFVSQASEIDVVLAEREIGDLIQTAEDPCPKGDGRAVRLMVEPEGVVAGSPGQDVVATATGQDVISRVADKHVIVVGPSRILDAGQIGDDLFMLEQEVLAGRRDIDLLRKIGYDR